MPITNFLCAEKLTDGRQIYFYRLFTVAVCKANVTFVSRWYSSAFCLSFLLYKANSLIFLSVDIQLDEPLWKVLLSPGDVAIEVLTLCSQLEPLCKQKYTVIIWYVVVELLHSARCQGGVFFCCISLKCIILFTVSIPKRNLFSACLSGINPSSDCDFFLLEI